MKSKKLIISICILSIFILIGCIVMSENQVKLRSFNSDLDGIWETELSDGTDLSITIESENEEVYLTSKKEGCSYFPLRDSKIKDGKLHLVIPRKSSNMIFELSLTKDDRLVGSSEFYDDTEDVSFTRESTVCIMKETETTEFNHLYSDFQNLIKENSEYGDDNLNYEFSYDLGNKDALEDTIKKYNIDVAAGDKKDVELMEALLNWECDLLDHSSNNIANKTDLNSLIEDGLENGTNCRGLSLILAQVLRMYGVKAQAIICEPYTDIFSDCHVVVNAYSDELKQWIMLDPTNRLILKDENGEYVNVESLRENIENNVKMIRNSNAGYNQSVMTDAQFDEYLNYMAKNSCKYIKTEENYDGSDGAEDNVQVVLVSNNYEEPKDYSYKYKKIVTTNSEKFWNN